MYNLQNNDKKKQKNWKYELFVISAVFLMHVAYLAVKISETGSLNQDFMAMMCETLSTHKSTTLLCDTDIL